MSFYLRILEGKNQGEEYLLTEGENLVGRSRSSHVRVYNEDVSGKHFVLEITDHGIFIHNISAHGTMIDGMEVLKDAEIRPGQIITAGQTLKMLFCEFQDDESAGNLRTCNNEITCVTKFVADTNITIGKSNAEPDNEATAVTKIQQKESHIAEEENGDETQVTRIASDIEGNGDETQVTRFASDVEENGDETQVTRFASDVEENGDETQVSDTASDVEENGDETQVSNTASDAENQTAPGIFTDIGEDTVLPESNDSLSEINEQTQSAPHAKPDGENTVPEGDLSGNETKQGSADDLDKTPLPEEIPPPDAAAQQNSGEAPSAQSAPMEEQGMFFEEDVPDSEKTNADETQVVQTRMASADEMNFIKNQIKKQQQSRLFFKFLFIALVVVLLGIIWMMKTPQKETVLSWPQREIQDGKFHLPWSDEKAKMEFLTDYCEAWNGGFKNGTFDVYYPQWPGNQVERNGNTICIHTFLGKNGDVPLEITLIREASTEFVFENRSKALERTIRRMEVNYEIMQSENHFFVPDTGAAENGIPYDLISYQREGTAASQNGRDADMFGIMRFFRFGQYNYILRAEVLASERSRAAAVLLNDTFLSFHPHFVRTHWEGSSEYGGSHKIEKGDMRRIIMGIKDELRCSSQMEYQKIEHEIKRVLAQTRYNDQKEEYMEAIKLLLDLRAKQQQWYNGESIRWATADANNDQMEKVRIREEGKAIFSKDDKRRYDILTDNWGN